MLHNCVKILAEEVDAVREEMRKIPTWLVCADCGEMFYTAATVKEGEEGSCEKCGGELEIAETGSPKSRRFRK